MADAPTPLDLDEIRASRSSVGYFGNDLADKIDAVIDEVERLRAEVAMTARPAPAWDEDAVRESALKRAYRVRRTPIHEDDAWAFGEGARAGIESILAVVRDHLPVKPGREDVARALDPKAWSDPITGKSVWGATPEAVRQTRRHSALVQADAVLSQLPGRSEAEVKAEALREFADAHLFPSRWIMFRHDDGTAVTVGDALRARADRLAAEGGAS